MAQYPGAIRRPITAPKGRRPMSSPVRVNLHVAASEAKSLHGYFNQTGIPDSHFYVRRDGTVEQMVDTSMRAFADLQGNPDTISIETQGGATSADTEKWTSAQLEALANLVAWAHKTHGVPLALARDSKPGRSSHGLSWHRLGVPGNFPNTWPLWGLRVGGRKYSNAAGKTCPGTAKIQQAPAVLKRAKEIAAGDGASVPSSSAGVERVQKILADLGYLDTEKWLIDGVLGDATRAAVRDYQHDADLVTDGDPGPITTSHMEDTMKKLDALAIEVDKIKQAVGQEVIEGREFRATVLDTLADVPGAIETLEAARKRAEQNNKVLSVLDPRNPANQKA